MNAYRWPALPVLAASALLVAGPFVGFAYAQNEPVYAVYDGFFVTDEGQYVLSFAYFSHNFEPAWSVGPPTTHNISSRSSTLPVRHGYGSRFRWWFALDGGSRG